MKSKIGAKQLLEDFVDWLKDCGEDAFYVFNKTDEAIDNFLNNDPFN